MFRPRFRLITLLAVTTLIALAAGVFGIYRRAAMAEDLAYKKIAARGGWIVVYTNDSHVAVFDNVPRMCNINFNNTRVTLAAAKKFAARHPSWRVYHSNASLNVN
jgi:hypothetical protein